MPIGEFSPQPNLSALYHLSDTSDSSGNNYTLTNNNSVVFTDYGRFGKAADFGTANTDKRLSRADVLGLNLSEYTISCWVKINTEITSGFYDLVALEHATNGYSILYYDFNGGNRRLMFDYSTGTNTFNITLGTTKWYFLTGTKSATLQRLYVDGALVSTRTPSAPTGGGNNRMTIGSTSAGNANFANAVIDEVAIFNRALSQQEISRYYQWSLGRFARLL